MPNGFQFHCCVLQVTLSLLQGIEIKMCYFGLAEMDVDRPEEILISLRRN